MDMSIGQLNKAVLACSHFWSLFKQKKKKKENRLQCQ